VEARRPASTDGQRFLESISQRSALRAPSAMRTSARWSPAGLLAGGGDLCGTQRASFPRPAGAAILIGLTGWALAVPHYGSEFVVSMALTCLMYVALSSSWACSAAARATCRWRRRPSSASAPTPVR
jgi:hypothetical protein